MTTVVRVIQQYAATYPYTGVQQVTFCLEGPGVGAVDIAQYIGGAQIGALYAQSLNTSVLSTPPATDLQECAIFNFVDIYNKHVTPVLIPAKASWFSTYDGEALDITNPDVVAIVDYLSAQGICTTDGIALGGIRNGKRVSRATPCPWPQLR
jgi:hypothetical protein